VWEKAHVLALSAYRATRTFPSDEVYGLRSQIRRSSSSIPANIAEGCGRNGNAELTRFLHISMGSASELEYHPLLARDLGYLSDSDHLELERGTAEVKRMLTSLLHKLTADG